MNNLYLKKRRTFTVEVFLRRKRQPLESDATLSRWKLPPNPNPVLDTQNNLMGASVWFSPSVRRHKEMVTRPHQAEIVIQKKICKACQYKYSKYVNFVFNVVISFAISIHIYCHNSEGAFVIYSHGRAI